MEEHYIKDVGKITYEYGVNLEEHKMVIEKQQKRIAELEQELAIKDKMINLIWIDLFHLNNDNNDWTKSLDKYKQEAQAKLQELKNDTFQGE